MRSRDPHRRTARLSGRLVAVAVAAAAMVASVWHEGGTTWRKLDRDYNQYAAYSPPQREQAPILGTGLDPDLFAFVASKLVPGDRVYFQVPRTSYGTLDLYDTVALIGRFAFLPAVEVEGVDDATVVFSYDSDPAQLHRTFIDEAHWSSSSGVSRLSYP